jgi:hypothetical protein
MFRFGWMVRHTTTDVKINLNKSIYIYIYIILSTVQYRSIFDIIQQDNCG